MQSFEQAKPILKSLHPSDIARILEEVSPESRKKIITLLPLSQASEAISEMDLESNPAEILTSLSPEQAAALIEELDPDDAADLLAQIPLDELRLIMEKISDEEERIIKQLMTYPEDTAGGIMNPQVLRIPAEFTKRKALEEVTRISEEMEDFYAIYVVDDNGHLLGVVALKDLIRAHPNAKVKNLILPDLVKVDVTADQEEAARLLIKYALPAIPVVNQSNVLLGRITFDDVLDVIQEENTEDLLKFAGVSEEEGLRGRWLDSVRSRIPWLLINLVTASLAGFVLASFEATIEKLVVIASFFPVVAGVAGNGATQALTVTIRRIATGRVDPKDFIPIIIKELIVGLTNGILLGIITAIVALILNQNPMLGLVVFCALTGNLLIAGMAGSSVPLLLQRLGVDPAVASSILITAFTDILGYTILLSLSAWLLL